MVVLPLATILSQKEIEKMASRSNLRFGKQMAESAKIVFTLQNIFHITATVEHKNAALQTVDLLSTNKGLQFKCSCTNKKNVFCEHCTAVALKMVDLKMQESESND